MPGLSCDRRASLVVARWLLSCGMWTLSCGMHVGSSSLTRDRARGPCIRSVESYPLCHQGGPNLRPLYSKFSISAFQPQSMNSGDKWEWQPLGITNAHGSLLFSPRAQPKSRSLHSVLTPSWGGAPRRPLFALETGEMPSLLCPVRKHSRSPGSQRVGR